MPVMDKDVEQKVLLFCRLFKSIQSKGTLKNIHRPMNINIIIYYC